MTCHCEWIYALILMNSISVPPAGRSAGEVYILKEWNPSSGDSPVMVVFQRQGGMTGPDQIHRVVFISLVI
jgi:hypothetical protein